MSFTELAALASSVVTVVTAIAALVSFISKNSKNKQWMTQFFLIAFIAIAVFSGMFAATLFIARPQIAIDGKTRISLPGQPSATDTLASGIYSTVQPGAKCDTHGGIWTTKGIGNIVCGTQVIPNVPDERGYLYLQLPDNRVFSLNNKINVIGNPNTPNGFLQCMGLDEQDANTGFLVEYCGDGHWFIYTISSDGTILQSLDQGLTTARATVDMSLTLKGTILTFSIDKETYSHNNIVPIQPIKVAIMYRVSSGSAGAVTSHDFSYVPLSN